MSAENARVRVLIRCRPPADDVDPEETIKLYAEQQGLVNFKGKAAEDGGEPTEREFLFDDAIEVACSQEEVFARSCKPQVDHVLEGFNACMFAYGQTGSGKTYTIFGEEGEKKGVVPRTMEYLFASIKKRSQQKKVAVFVSFLEVYLDKLRDLGKGSLPDNEGRVEFKGASKEPKSSSRPGTASSRKSDKDGVPDDLEIRENPNGTVYVQDLTSIPVGSVEEVMAVIKSGLSKRATYQTLMNEHSSRSHTVVSVTCVVEGKDGGGGAVTGKLNLVDLAGCERLKRSGAGDVDSGVADANMRAKEAVIINKSLSTLGTVVMALAKGDASYVPYRDSKLTRLLQDSLGGNSHTTLLATLHPRPADAEESLSTLQFANRCRNVMTQPHINYIDADPESQAKIIEKLMKEIAELKDELGAQKNYYEEKLKSQGSAEVKSTMPEESTMERSESQAALGSGEAKGESRGTSRGSRRTTTGDKGRGGTASEAQAAALAEAQALSREMKEKFVKKNNEFRAAQEAARKNEERLKREIEEYRTKLTTVTEDLNSKTQMHAASTQEQSKRYEKEIEHLRDHNNKLLNDMDSALRNVPEKLRVDSEKLRNADDKARQATMEKESEMLAALKKASEDQEKGLGLQREQYEYWLKKKNDELKSFVTELETFKTEKTRQINDLEKHSLYLFDYSNQLATVIANFEKGLYPVYEKSGIKAVQIPEKAKPGPMDLDTLRDLAKYKKRADDFIRSHPTGMSASFTVQNPTAAVSGQVGAMALENTGGAEAQKLRDDLQSVKEKLSEAERRAAASQDEVREKVEQEVLNDLADHPTVEYIKRIEDERTYYKEQLAEEVRRCKDLRVALDARERVIAKTQTMGRTGMTRTMNTSGSRLPNVTGTSRGMPSF